MTPDLEPISDAPTPALDVAVLTEALRRAGPRAVLSHEVAAEVLGIELLEPVALRLTVPRNRSRLTVPGWQVVRSDVAADDRSAEDDLRVTAAARTVADLARVLPVREALVAAESALRRGLVPTDELVRRLLDAEGRGAARLREVGRLVDPASGSVLETLLRWALHEAGVPAPQTQHKIRDEDGIEVARVDFCWPAARLVVEADGFAYHKDRQAYRRDRERGNELVRLGWRVLRFTWEDVLQRPWHVVSLVRQCLRAGPAAHEVARSAA